MTIKTYYAGVGARKTPKNILDLMTTFAKKAEEKGAVLRSGGAKGADSAFEAGVVDVANKQIFTPKSVDVDWESAFDLVDIHHPNPNALSSYARLLMGRNAFQVLGPHLDTPSEGVICWTPDGLSTYTTRATGGTGQAIRIAIANSITVLNLGDTDVLKEFTEDLESWKEYG